MNPWIPRRATGRDPISGHSIAPGIYYTDVSDLPVIEASVARLREKLKKPVAIEILPLQNYYPAEEYHQKYLEKNPSGYCHIG